MSDDRFAVRIRDIRRHRLARIVLAVVVALVAAFLVWVVWFSGLLAVHGVKVEGETTLRESQVLRTAQVPDGRPLARVDLAAIKARVASLDRVESVDVSRSWPRTITIDVIERRPVAWTTDAGEIRGIDRFGIDYRSFASEPKSLIEAKILATDPEARLEVTEAVASVIDLVTRKDRSLRREVQSISAATKDSIELDLTGGRTIVWGSAAKGDRKLEVLGPLLRIDASRYDVSAPDQPTTRQ